MKPQIHRPITVILSLLMTAAIIVAATACAGTAATPTATSAPQKEAPKEQTKETPKPQASPTSAPAAAAPKTLKTVKVGMLGKNLSNAGIYIAEEKGYFKEQGIQIDEIPFDLGPKMIPALSTNQIDVGAGGPSAGLYNAVARDIQMKVVADKGNAAPGMGWQGIVIRKDLYDSGVKTVKDLKGKKLGIVGLGASQEVAAAEYHLPKAGLTAKDVDLVEVPFPDMPAALANKAIDAAMPIEPGLTQIQQKGLGVLVETTDKAYPNQQISVIMYSLGFTQQPDLAKGFMIAYLKGVRDYNDAFVKNKNKKEIVDLLEKAKVITDPALVDKMGITGLNPNGYVNAEGMKKDQDYFIKAGEMKTPADLDKVIDNSYVDNAIKVLGKYQ